MPLIGFLGQREQRTRMPIDNPPAATSARTSSAASAAA